MSNTWGSLFKLHSFGESHGVAMGGIVEGMPAGFKLDVSALQQELNRRKASINTYSTTRFEPDELIILSGIEHEICLGSPIGFLIWNKAQKPQDYKSTHDILRPSHADYTYLAKYGLHAQSGGGRSSARETLSRVVAGAMAKQVLCHYGITVQSWIQQIGPLACKDIWDWPATQLKSESMCPEIDVWNHMQNLIETTQKQGNTLGGTIRCIITGVPAGIGEPVFDKLHAKLGQGMLSIPTVKAVAFADAIACTSKFGSETNDEFYTDAHGKIKTHTNHSGGIQGGISNGMPICIETFFKPISSIRSEQHSVTHDGKATTFAIEGRHDVCVLPRALPIVEAMAAMTILDFWMLQQLKQFKA